MERRDLLLALIYGRGKTLKDNEKIPSETHLQKEMFLLMKETIFSKSKEYEFKPHYYGPFSAELRDDLNLLVYKGLIDEDDGIRLTPLGFKKAASVWRSMGTSETVAVIRIKEQYNFNSIDGLSKYVYSKFPMFTVKSALRRDVIYSYFEKFYDENSLTEDYIMQAYNRNQKK
ncbi:MAG: hypothetical protein M1476_04295 [Candidatus Thermoplasmatota archaeon]|nr:hypothetical protein [Candidatus Thermoplasmatota archaeon]